LAFGLWSPVRILAYRPGVYVARHGAAPVSQIRPACCKHRE
jgi:hypothetical protein